MPARRRQGLWIPQATGRGLPTDRPQPAHCRRIKQHSRQTTAQQLHSQIKNEWRKETQGRRKRRQLLEETSSRLGFVNQYGIFQQRSNRTSDPRNCPWRRPWHLGRNQPSGRVWQRQSGREVPGHEAAHGGRRCCPHRYHSSASAFRPVWIIMEDNR